jgi:ectoine hydroxylase-related dioxygenase (phytanoyl-CoA dioxygenase family)
MSLKKFNKNGFIIKKNVLSKKDINLLVKMISFNLNRFKKKTLTNVNILSWKNKTFTRKIMFFRKQYPKLFSYYYDLIQTNVTLKKITSKEIILKNVAKLMKIDINSVSHSNSMIRLDGPSDDKNIYGWHQERSYYKMNNRSGGIFVWIALVDMTKEIGPLEVCSGSHKSGFIKPNVKRKKNGSLQNILPAFYLNKYKKSVKSIRIKAGDAIFCNMNTFHKSGKNISGLFRMSFISRFHDSHSDDFNSYSDPGNYNYHPYNNLKLKKLGII